MLTALRFFFFFLSFADDEIILPTTLTIHDGKTGVFEMRKLCG